MARRKQGQNDVPQLPDRMQTIRQDSARQSAIPLPYLLQDIQRNSAASTTRNWSRFTVPHAMVSSDTRPPKLLTLKSSPESECLITSASARRISNGRT